MFRKSMIAALAALFAFAPVGEALASSFTGTVGAYVRGRMTATNDLSSVAAEISSDFNKAIVAGTGSGAADILFADERTLAASATENLDLAGGLTDALGVSRTCVDVKAIVIKAAAANTNSVVVGGAGSNTFVGPFADATDKVTIPPGGVVSFVHPGAGWTVTAATGDILLVANSAAGTGVDYEIVIVCASA